MIRLLTIFFVALFAISTLRAQPSNDNCENAIELTDLDNDCHFYEYDGASFNTYNGSCSTFPLFANVWFKFTAPGTSIDVSVANASNVTGKLAIVQFEPQVCQLNSLTEIACGTDVIEEDGVLTIGGDLLFSGQF